MRYKFIGFLCLVLSSVPGSFCYSQAEMEYRNPVVFQRFHDMEVGGKSLKVPKIWIMEEDGTGLRQLTFGTEYDDHPSVYADQRHILYSAVNAPTLDRGAGASLIKMHIATGSRTVYAKEDGWSLHHAALSPLDEQLVYHRDNADVNGLWVGWGPDRYELPTIATNGVALADGVIFMHERDTDINPREVAIVRMYGRGKDTRLVFLTDNTCLHRRPAISPDGRLLAWQTNAAGSDDEIFLADIDGGDARNLTRTPGNDGHPWFSRDGRWIVFESDRSGNWEIWKIHLETREMVQLTDGQGEYQSTRPRM